MHLLVRAALLVPVVALGFPAGASIPLPGATPVSRASSALELGAQERLSRTFGPEHGLGAAPVWAIAQDSIGFLWIGAEGGLFRFDGTELLRWAPHAVHAAVTAVAISPEGGEVVALDVRGGLHRVVGDGVEAMEWPGDPVRGMGWSLAFDGDGTLWRTADGTVWSLPRGGTWAALPAAHFEHEPASSVRSAASGGVVVTTRGGAWRRGAGDAFERVYEAGNVASVSAPGRDRFLVLAGEGGGWNWRVVEIEEGAERVLLSHEQVPDGRPIDLVERKGTLWLTMDRYLVAVGSNGGVEVLDREDGIESGGPLFLDREGSLWMGSFVGLHQFPEPDTRIWTEREGLGSRHVRFLARSGEAVWAMTWSGPSYLRQSEGGGWVARRPAWDSRSHVCDDGAGGAWTGIGAPLALVHLRDTASVPVRMEGTAPGAPALGAVRGCTPSPDGGVWVGTDIDLRYLDPELGAWVVPFPFAGEPVLARLHDSRDRIWVAVEDRVCRAPAARVLAGEEGVWRCDAVPLAEGITSIVEMPSGAIWASSHRVGVAAWDGAAWELLPMDDLPSRSVFRLVPSPRGGVWLVGSGILQRVVERSPAEAAEVDPVDGARAPAWDVVERLTRWHGLPAVGAGDLLEDEDGTIWLASSRGLIRVPAEVRFTPPPVPRVALVGAGVDGSPVPVDGTLVLPHDRNRLEARFTALSFRDPSLVRHQVRLGPEEAWAESREQPSFRWVDLGPGGYQAEYRASLDGETWTAEPVRFAFRVRSPWYRTGWFLALVGLLATGLVWSAYRARVAYLLGLERQRTRIAMDLHDEVGSGLASVGILSGVLAADGLGETERRSTAVEIATAAEELGHALSDIVWSLDPRTATIEELGTRLAEHGERLCAGDVTGFSAALPAPWPAESLDVGVRRNVLRIGLEALHNAARHANARRVTFAIRPLQPGVWRLEVRDDGRGTAGGNGLRPGELAPGRNGAGGGGPATGAFNPGRGHGIRWMHRRAAEIGARLAIDSEPGCGTTVTLDFPLQERARRGVGRWLER